MMLSSPPTLGLVALLVVLLFRPVLAQDETIDWRDDMPQGPGPVMGIPDGRLPPPYRAASHCQACVMDPLPSRFCFEDMRCHPRQPTDTVPDMDMPVHYLLRRVNKTALPKEEEEEEEPPSLFCRFAANNPEECEDVVSRCLRCTERIDSKWCFDTLSCLVVGGGHPCNNVAVFPRFC